ncbi:kinase-like domain-containing protein [Rhizophagus irregularis DAOM 181602=DAOM 197198]|nr:kinase-like domain-containing protein [Rhizophagus irregularis DAOM 181602=DAOM 197198]
MEKKPRNKWKSVDPNRNQRYVTTTELEDADERAIYMKDLYKRKQVYGICGECNEPGTGQNWCQPCNAKRFEDNFKNWTSGNKDIDKVIQESQLNAVHFKKFLEWIPFEKFQNITYVAKGGFGKIYSAEWPEGISEYWDIENQKWHKITDLKVALKSLDNSSDICSDFLNEIKSHLEIFLYDTIQCFGVTQDPNTKDYMMVLYYCRMCRPANKYSDQKERIYGVLPYVAPEVLRGHHYTKAADIYSFGIIMNEFLSEETPYSNISFDGFLAIKICQGYRPEISKNIPQLLADIIIKCWDAEIKNRPTTKELYQILKKWNEEKRDNETVIYSQLKECNEIGKKNFESRLSKNTQSHSQAIYTSKLLNFKNLPKPVNSSNLSSFQFNLDINNIPSLSILEIPTSECLDLQLNESALECLDLQLNESANLNN